MNSKAATPKWPKPKDEGWCLVLGQVDTGELWALKRVGFVRGCLTSSITMVVPEKPGMCSVMPVKEAFYPSSASEAVPTQFASD